MAVPVMKGAMFREVSAPASNSTRWKSITVCTGASASTLQDIKVPESSGSYSYLDSGVPSSGVRNRFIYWRTYQDVLELVEESLDVTLSGNMVRYRFQDSPVLPSVSVHESHDTVLVLVATVASIQRLVFPHPSKMARQQNFVLSEQVASSIFYDASLPDLKNQYLLTPGGSINAQLMRAASCLTDDGHALFSMATTTGSILLVKMPPLNAAGVILQQELSCSSVMKKLWNGLIPGAMRGSQFVGETAVSLEMIFLGGDIYIFTVCRDFRLRVWSTKTKDCVLIENLLDYSSEEAEDSSVPMAFTGSNHVLKAVLGGNSNSICVFLSLQNKTKFVFLTPKIENNRLKIEHLTTLDKSPLEDLVDFVVTETYLLSLWTTQAGETQVLALSLEEPEENARSEWEAVMLSPPVDQVVVPCNQDPRDVFLTKIFSPGLFSPQDIVRALTVYRRIAAPAAEADTLINMTALKEEVTNAVDTEILNNVSDYEIQEEAYLELQREQWENFYSCCFQYKQVGERAKGIFADPVTGLFGIIKKSTFSLLRPCNITEVLYLSPTERLPESLIEAEGLAGDDISADQIASDVRKTCDALQLLSVHITPEVAETFYSSLQSLHEPEELLSKLRDSLEMDLIQKLVRLTRCMRSPVAALEAVLSILQLADDVDLEYMEGPECAGHAHYSHLFSGGLGLWMLTQGFQQMVSLHFNLSRNLALYISILAHNWEEAMLSCDAKETLVNELLPTSLHLLRCYKVLVWASYSLSTISPNSTLDTNLRQLESLDITDKNTSPHTQIGSKQSYLMKLFLEGVGGEQVRRRLSALNEGSPACWLENLQQFLQTAALLIWPACEDTLFPEFLVRSCQYLRLQEYVHLLTPWCTWNEGSRNFLLGLAYLHFDEPLKAVKLFVDASDGVATEPFLLEKLLQTDETDYCRLKILYYLKVIAQLEEQGLSDLVITMATEAISKALPDDPNLPTLQSKIFVQHLELGHNQEAFTAMMNNPDSDRRKNCLRQFLVVLCERGQLSDLVSFDYNDLEEEVVYILENRARSVDLSTHDYYNLLYSFFICRGDNRKAGRAMYERSLRLAQEVPGLRSLQLQAQSKLAALSILNLVQPEYAWTLKSFLVRGSHGAGGDSGGSRVAKHDVDGQRKDLQASGKKRRLEIVELADLERESLLLDARLRLIRNQPDSALVSGPMPSPQELLSLLCAAGLYDMAVSLTRAFSLSPETVLASLALRCVALATLPSATAIPTSGLAASQIGSNKPDAGSEAWQWLRENNIPPCGARETSAADKAWSLLQSYLSVLEDGSGQSHKCIAHTLLSQGFHLPTWLINSYKSLDVASLLRVYLTFDLLTQAATLANDYLEAVTESLTGVDEPSFKIHGQNTPKALSVWIPYTCLDQLFAALRDTGSSTHAAMYQRVKEKLDKYQTKSYEISVELRAMC